MYIYQDRDLLKTVFYFKTDDRGLTQTYKFLVVFNAENNFSIFVKNSTFSFSIKIVFRDEFYPVAVTLNCPAFI